MGTVFIGIDPAYAKPIAWAQISESGMVEAYGLADSPGYRHAAACANELIHDWDGGQDVVACIESPYASRAAAGLHRMGGAITLALLMQFGDKVSFLYPTSTAWRKVVLSEIRKEKGLDRVRKLGPKWKQLAVGYACRLAGEEIKSDDIAEAICLAEYARRFANGD